ncbi:hypothetical protein ALC53_07550, partial [Atta colombica]
YSKLMSLNIVELVSYTVMVASNFCYQGLPSVLGKLFESSDNLTRKRIYCNLCENSFPSFNPIELCLQLSNVMFIIQEYPFVVSLTRILSIATITCIICCITISCCVEFIHVIKCLFLINVPCFRVVDFLCRALVIDCDTEIGEKSNNIMKYLEYCDSSSTYYDIPTPVKRYSVIFANCHDLYHRRKMRFYLIRIS